MAAGQIYVVMDYDQWHSQPILHGDRDKFMRMADLSQKEDGKFNFKD
jgi:hypothetical protein